MKFNNTITILSIAFLFSCKELVNQPQEKLGERVIEVYKGTPDNPSVYFSTVKSMNVEVVYEAGADPSNSILDANYTSWNYLEFVLEHIFNTLKNKNLFFSMPNPSSSTLYRQITSQPFGTKYNVDKILELGNHNKSNVSNSSSAHIIILFLNGNFYDSTDNTTDTTVLAVTLQGAGMIAVFKKAIITFSSLGKDQRVLETLVLIHEIGHILGLVDVGTPPFDISHSGKGIKAAHCTTASCIMEPTISAGGKPLNLNMEGAIPTLQAYLGLLKDKPNCFTACKLTVEPNCRQKCDEYSLLDNHCLNDFINFNP